jgi:hypothetical protein
LIVVGSACAGAAKKKARQRAMSRRIGVLLNLREEGAGRIHAAFALHDQ